MNFEDFYWRVHLQVALFFDYLSLEDFLVVGFYYLMTEFVNLFCPLLYVIQMLIAYYHL